jgi:hypothetical protein
MEVPVLGIVENMAYFQCPDCGSQHEIFGTSKIDDIAKGYGIDLIARIPISTSFAGAMDKGAVENLEVTELAPFVADIVKKVDLTEF